ncbi:MAG: glycogen synthase GlgA [Candidatus Omnitrophica bacterium]|nr:glycogen synthase GlgA [Candidatus Omnitrophota bacterium]
MKILFCASEVAPFAKTGGLADVTGSLPPALGRLGVKVRLMMPRYRGVAFSEKKIARNVEIHCVEHEGYFNRSGIYGQARGDYSDNLERFSFFCEQALLKAKETGFRPDIVHAHDWQTALLPVLLKTRFSGDPFFRNTKSVLTIHNLAYQGHFPAHRFGALGLDPGLFSVSAFEFYGKINLLKGGILFADRLNTVSPAYAREMETREYGFGLEGVVKSRRAVLGGILNGIDNRLWNPSADRRLAARFSASRQAGKADCKAALQRACGFDPDPAVPLFGFVSRLAEQKGVDILAEAAEHFLQKKAQFVLLGEGDAVYHTLFGNLGARHPDRAKVIPGFDPRRAHEIYAGSDFFLMPSLFEPCGLGQLISFRYGTLPVVRATGGLADTVVDADEDARRGNGFVFAERRATALLGAIDRACAAYRDPGRMRRLRARVMKLDFSWAASAQAYLEFYKETVRS